MTSTVTPGNTPASSSQAPARDRHTDPPTPAPLQAVARRSITTWAARTSTSATYSARCSAGFSGRPETQARPRRGRDVEQPVELTLEEAYAGTTRLVQTVGDGATTRRIEVKIPAGVKDGSRVRAAGEGGPGIGGGPNGDLYLVISIKPHATMERVDDDLRTEVSVPLTVTALGGEVQVPTMKGRVALKIPPETQNGKMIRLGGLGMPRLGKTGNGDLIAKVKVVLPTNLGQRERELFEELRRVRPDA